MADLAEGLETWAKQMEGATKLSANDRAKITGAGALAYAEVLKRNTPRSERDYSKKGKRAGKGKGRQTKHIADDITFKPGWTMDRVMTGDTSVGWGSKYSAMIAKFVNEGAGEPSQLRVENMHFMERAELQARDAVLQAELAEYKKVMHQ